MYREEAIEILSNTDHLHDVPEGYYEALDMAIEALNALIQGNAVCESCDPGMDWIIHKFPADLQRYAECPNCGFHYSAGILDGIKFIDVFLYPYCPMCGNKMNEQEYEYIEHESDRNVWEYFSKGSEKE